jgi:tRNA A-37 threonylcarbamoyl transferase component Bud32
MNEENRCPQCGVPLPAHAPQGLCPGCLLKRGLDTTPLPSGEAGPASGVFTPPTPEQLAAQFPELEILEFIGRGGMGMVYKARQKHLDRLVALKILVPNIAQDPAFADRFAREARAMAMLTHPHVVAVHDFGQKDGLYYFLMEFVDGLTLRQLLGAGKLAPQAALAIVPQICEALQYAHDKGVVHRDIKPENILMDRSGQVKIADFGLAKLMGREAKDFSLTGAGQVMGTPQYMAPEQIEHPLEVDHRADIYSLGVVFYQMLTGELPIGRFAPPSKKVQIDVRLDEVVLRALEKEPELRYQQASHIKAAVETIVATPSPAVIDGKRQRRNLPLFVERGGRRHVSWPGALLFCGTLGLVVLGVNLAIALALWLLNAPVRLTFQPGELLLVLCLVAACGVMRAAALKLGSSEVARAGSAPAAKVGTVRKVLRVRIIVAFMGMTVAAAIAAGVAFFSSWMSSVFTSELADWLNKFARIAVWIAISVAVGWYIIRRVWRSGSKPQAGPPGPSEAGTGRS